jgi:hypothetical protein
MDPVLYPSMTSVHGLGATDYYENSSTTDVFSGPLAAPLSP